MTKKNRNFFCSGYVIKNMPNKTNDLFTSPEDRMSSPVSGIIVFGIKWLTNVFVIKQEKIQIKIIIQSKNIPLFVNGTKSGKFHKPQ